MNETNMNLYQRIEELYQKRRHAEQLRLDGLRDRIRTLLVANHNGQQLLESDVAELMAAMHELDVTPVDLRDVVMGIEAGRFVAITSVADRLAEAEGRSPFRG
jgi:hypothetical protein